MQNPQNSPIPNELRLLLLERQPQSFDRTEKKKQKVNVEV